MVDVVTDAPATGFDEFFAARYESAVRGAYLLTSSASAAEDVAQEAVTEVFRRWHEIDHPPTYLCRCVTSRSLDWVRRQGRLERNDRIEAASSPQTAPDSTAADDVMVVRAALARLPEVMRAVLVLRYFAGMSDPEIAEATGMRLGTVKSRLRRGLDRIREQLS